MLENYYNDSDDEDLCPSAASSEESEPLSSLSCLRKYFEIENDRYVKRIKESIRRRNMEFIDSLLSQNFDVYKKDLHGKNAVSIAACSLGRTLFNSTKENFELLDKMIQHGGSSQFWANSSELIHHVLQRKKEHQAIGIIFFLIKRYANIHGPFTNEIVNVVDTREFLNILKLLVSKNININFIQSSNDPYFHSVVKNDSDADRTNFVQTLLDGGVDINATNASNELAIDVCCDKYKAILKKHIVKVIAAGLDVAKKNCEAVKDDEELIKYRDECDKEVLKMKNTRIKYSKITFDKILTLNIHKLTVRLTHADLDKILYIDSHTYTIYKDLLYYRLSHISVRKMLLNSIGTFQNTLLLELPMIFIFELYSYLTDQDLQLLAALN